MDGLKGVIPDSCSDVKEALSDLFGNKTENTKSVMVANATIF
jgi:hypothetical protein